MSLEDEMLEQNSMYQSAVQENEELREENERLKDKILFEHIDALEKLVKAQRTWMLDIAPRSYLDGAKAAPLREQWDALFEGKTDPLQQE